MGMTDRKNPVRADSSESRFSVMEFMRQFPDDDACMLHLWRTRYSPDGEHAECPRCKVTRTFKHYANGDRRQSWTCTTCGLHVHPTAGTIFHKSSTSLQLWFYAMWLITSTRCGISAKQLERELGVTYKTAWRMFNLIRNELMGPVDTLLSGKVEMDETYVGGKPRLEDKRAWADAPSRAVAAQNWSHENKVRVFGMVERNKTETVDEVETKTAGKIAAYVIPEKPQAEIVQHMANHVEGDTIIYTDDARLYTRLAKDGWDHRTINHYAGVYVSGDIHTQTIEGFWSLVKRISGTHHAVSAKWLQGYVNEYVWRYNRDDSRSMFLSILLRAALD